MELRKEKTDPTKSNRDTTSENTSTPDTPNKEAENTNSIIPNTPNIMDKKIDSGEQNEKVTTKEEINEVSQEEVTVRLGNESVIIPLADFEQLAAELASTKAKEMHYAAAEPNRPMFKITPDKSIPTLRLTQSLVITLVIATFPLAQQFFKKVQLKKKKKAKKTCSFL